jgi:hypothetical protein
MRTVGNCKIPPITFSASAESFIVGARFNDEMSRLSGGGHVPKGVYYFKTHKEANQFDLDCLAKKMAKMAAKRAYL